MSKIILIRFNVQVLYNILLNEISQIRRRTRTDEDSGTDDFVAEGDLFTGEEGSEIREHRGREQLVI